MLATFWTILLTIVVDEPSLLMPTNDDPNHPRIVTDDWHRHRLFTGCAKRIHVESAVFRCGINGLAYKPHCPNQPFLQTNGSRLMLTTGKVLALDLHGLLYPCSFVFCEHVDFAPVKEKCNDGFCIMSQMISSAVELRKMLREKYSTT